MTILATDANYALASHEAIAGNLRIGDILDIGPGARIVLIGRITGGFAPGVMVTAVMPDGDRKIRSYDITDIVAVRA